MKEITLERRFFVDNYEENEFDWFLRQLGVDADETFLYDKVDIIIDDEIEVY